MVLAGALQTARPALCSSAAIRRHSRVTPDTPATRRLHIVQAKGQDAAKNALSKLFEGKKDILAANERTEEGGDGGDSGGDAGDGGSGGFNFGSWWQGFHESMDPYLRFFAAFLVLNLFPVMVDLVSGGWEVIPRMLRLNSSGRQLERMERAQVGDDDKKKLGQSEKSILEKYGDGTSDVA